MQYRILFSAICLLCLNCTTFSQTRTFIGGQLNADVELGNGFHPEPSIGITLNKQYTTHSGLEIGLFYRRTHDNFYIMSNGYYWSNIRIMRHNLVLPFAYKFYSRKVCFSAGIVVSQYLGWSDNGSDVEVSSYKSDDGSEVGLVFSISKQIKLSETDILEPIIYINPMAQDDLVFYTGIGLAYKFQVRKKE